MVGNCSTLCTFVPEMHYYLKYLRHYLVSHSRHGTHSPFVYRLVDEVLYQRPSSIAVEAVPLVYKRGGKKAVKKFLFLERLLKAFAFEEFKIADKSMQHDLVQLFERHSHVSSKRTMHYINTDADYSEILADVAEHDILIIEEPHLSENREKHWEFLKRAQNVVVTIDLFHLGLVFFRKGQRKENFLIRF